MKSENSKSNEPFPPKGSIWQVQGGCKDNDGAIVVWWIEGNDKLIAKLHRSCGMTACDRSNLPFFAVRAKGCNLRLHSRNIIRVDILIKLPTWLWINCECHSGEFVILEQCSDIICNYMVEIFKWTHHIDDVVLLKELVYNCCFQFSHLLVTLHIVSTMITSLNYLQVQFNCSICHLFWASLFREQQYLLYTVNPLFFWNPLLCITLDLLWEAY